MIKSVKVILLTALLILISGCQKEVSAPLKPKIDEKLPMVSSQSIKSIPDINSIALEWKAIIIPEVQGYHIIRADMQKEGKFKRVATLKNKYTTHYLDKDLDANSQYGYKISVYTKNGFESRASDSVKIVTLPNLQSVSLIQTISDLPRQIKILWRPHTNARVSKYIIERTSPSEPKWKKIATVDKRYNVEYIDTKLGDNKIFTYRIKSITFDNIVSEPSQISTATTKALPGQIKALEATTALPKKIQLSWVKSETQDVISYNIYRSNSATGSFAKIAKAPIAHNRYDDIISEDGKIYFYKITTVDKDSLESKINDLSPTMGSTLSKPKMPHVTLSQIQGNKMILNWESGDDRAVSYNIFKRVKDGWSSSKEKLIPNIREVRFEDPDVVRGVEYSYSIQAVDKHGLTSKQTDEITSKLPKIANKEQKN
ncbi:MAG: hypothetical protein U9N59_08490 [Campylobacterota bacterium]|nr:hypothetical protein [Campylobacterota bacterium]